jgi:hypothetical protein
MMTKEGRILIRKGAEFVMNLSRRAKVFRGIFLKYSTKGFN